MKLTIEIPDRHAGDVLQFIASLKLDIAPDHPELPLESQAEIRWAAIPGIDAVDPLQVAAERELVEDLTTTDEAAPFAAAKGIRPLLPPKVGGIYRTEGGHVMKIVEQLDDRFKGNCEYGSIYYLPSGKSISSVTRWDLVEELPF